MIKKTAVIVAALAMFLLASPAGAFSISPAGFRVTADPATTQIVRVKVKNNESTVANFKFDVLGARQDEHGLPLFGSGFDMAEIWVRPEFESLTLKPGEEKSVGFVIRVPPGIGPGGHYLGLAIKKMNGGTNSVTISGQLLAIMSLQVAGVANESLKINRWVAGETTSWKKIWPMYLTLVNTSNVEVNLLADAVIRNSAGKELARLPLDIGPDNLISGAVRVAEPKLDLAGKKIWWPGKYLVQLEVQYGLTHQTAMAAAEIYYYPLWLIWPGTILILAILISIFVWLHRRKIS